MGTNVEIVNISLGNCLCNFGTNNNDIAVNVLSL
jgi:hypothetical protein